MLYLAHQRSAESDKKHEHGDAQPGKTDRAGLKSELSQMAHALNDQGEGKAGYWRGIMPHPPDHREQANPAHHKGDHKKSGSPIAQDPRKHKGRQHTDRSQEGGPET